MTNNLKQKDTEYSVPLCCLPKYYWCGSKKKMVVEITNTKANNVPYHLYASDDFALSSNWPDTQCPRVEPPYTLCLLACSWIFVLRTAVVGRCSENMAAPHS